MKSALVTSALPYANGPIHIGHLVEYIQTDIWVRYWKLKGRDIAYMCADDTHGTPIMLRAQGEGISPETLIERIWHEHTRDFAGFQIEFDNYYSTHSQENRELSCEIYRTLKQRGYIVERAIEQPFCLNCNIFLPDRYIRGDCPRCGAVDQYGDACESCAATYDARQLINPNCAQCGLQPTWRESAHMFFRLNVFTDQLMKWVRNGHVQSEVANKLQEWFTVGLQDWDISRDAPYFGFEIPDAVGKYFYVWLDAPIGYMAATLNWCRKHGRDFDSYWRSDDTEVFHFIGKDIVYFHALFWPAVLMGSGFRTPTRLAVHGFLTVNGEKMSKSRGTFVTAETYLQFLDPQYLRYYYATKLNSRVEDLDLSVQDFVQRVNAELVNKIANIPSRVLAIVHRDCHGRLGALDSGGRALVNRLLGQGDEVCLRFEEREFSQAARLINMMVGEINGYLQEHKPWQFVSEEAAASICTGALNAFRVVATVIQPILPEFGKKFGAMMNLSELTWESRNEVIENTKVQPYIRLVERVDSSRVTEMMSASRPPSASGEIIEAPVMSLDSLIDCEFRTMKVMGAEIVPSSNDLVALTLGSGNDQRSVVAALGHGSETREVIGQNVLLLTNLKTKRFRGYVSHGMILAAGLNEGPVPVVVPTEQAGRDVE